MALKDVWSTCGPVISVKYSMLGRLFQSKWNNYNRDLRKDGQGATCVQQHLFNHFCTSDYCGFFQDVLLTFVNKTDPK